MERSRSDAVLRYFGLRGELQQPAWASSRLYFVAFVLVVAGLIVRAVEGPENFWDWTVLVLGVFAVVILAVNAREMRRKGR